MCVFDRRALALLDRRHQRRAHRRRFRIVGLVGRLWVQRSDGKYLFLMAFLSEQGKDVRQQLDDVVG